jgi:hypothetical protein
MTGSIIKRGKGTYLLRLLLGRDEQTGKRLYRTETVHGTKKEAEQILRDMVSRYEGGGLVNSERVSLNTYLQEWLRVAKKNKVGDRTFQNYSAHIERYVVKSIGPLPLAKVSVADVQGLYSQLADQGLGAPTIKLVHTILNQAFKQAVRWRKISYNPAADTERPRAKRKTVIRAMTKEQTARFLHPGRSIAPTPGGAYPQGRPTGGGSRLHHLSCVPARLRADMWPALFRSRASVRSTH